MALDIAAGFRVGGHAPDRRESEGQQTGDHE